MVKKEIRELCFRKMDMLKMFLLEFKLVYAMHVWLCTLLIGE